MAYTNFAPDHFAMMAVGLVSTEQAIPGGSGGTLLVTNTGDYIAFVTLGTSSAVVATPATGIAVLPGTNLPLAVGSNTNIAAITTVQSTTLNLAQGT